VGGGGGGGGIGLCMAAHQEWFDGESSKGACWNAHGNNYTRQIITSWPSRWAHGMSHAMMLPCMLCG
jgi:hypothetical protein